MSGHRTRLALPWGLAGPFSGTDLEVLRGLVWKAILVQEETLNVRDTERFLMELASTSWCSRSASSAIAVVFLESGRPSASTSSMERHGPDAVSVPAAVLEMAAEEYSEITHIISQFKTYCFDVGIILIPKI